MPVQNRDLIEICEKQKSIIEGLQHLGLNNEEIFDCLRVPDADYDLYVGSKLAHYNSIISLIDNLAFMKYSIESIRNQDLLYYFDYEDGVMADDALSLMDFSTSNYAGQQVVTSPDKLLNDILSPAMYQAIASKDVAKIKQLAEAITYTINHEQELL